MFHSTPSEVQAWLASTEFEADARHGGGRDEIATVVAFRDKVAGGRAVPVGEAGPSVRRASSSSAEPPRRPA